MKLDEAIQHLQKELGSLEHNGGCDECRQEHEQLLEWLKDYKTLIKPIEWERVSAADIEASERQLKDAALLTNPNKENILLNLLYAAASTLNHIMQTVESDEICKVCEYYKKGQCKANKNQNCKWVYQVHVDKLIWGNTE